jgi:transcription-repair coupling factor (superfamily II helicase)
MNAIDQIKEEICSRYGLEPEQVNVKLEIHELKKETAQEILADYTKYGEKPGYFFRRDTALKHKNDFAFGRFFHTITAFLKEGEQNES